MTTNKSDKKDTPTEIEQAVRQASIRARVKVKQAQKELDAIEKEMKAK